MYRNFRFLNETGCILNEKRMPDVTIMVPELEIVKQRVEYQYLNGKMRWNKKLLDLAPINPSFDLSVSRNSWLQVPTWRFLRRLLACNSTLG
jgi:phage pi2 protein 07